MVTYLYMKLNIFSNCDTKNITFHLKNKIKISETLLVMNKIDCTLMISSKPCNFYT